MANASVIVNENHTDGQVKFNITAFDLAGNNLTVNQTNLNSSNLTIDKNVPSVTNLSLYSNNSDPSLARAGDLINITLEVSEQIYNATLQIFDTETSMTESNNTAYANITVLQNSPNGLATFNITAYDGAGNEFNITQNDASANVIIDTVDPALSNLTIYSNNANPSLATVNNILSITITANEALKAANITILDSTYVMNVSGVVANASVNVSQDSDEGEVSFNITAFDLAGNSFTVDQTQLNSSNVTIDSSIPGVQTLSVTSNNTDPEFAMAGDTITVTLQVSEQIENSTLQILNDSITMIVNNDTASATVTVLENSTNGPVEFNITAYDETGNVFNVTSENITENNVVIDTINPSLANLTIYSNNANTSLATVNNILNITITANETLKAANITILDSTYVMNVSGVVANASVTVSQDSDEGEVSFNITAFDLAGNSFATNQTQLNSSNVIIDHSIPGVEDLNVASNNSNPKVAMAGDAITVTLQVSEQIGNSTLQILNNDIVMTINDDTASATITVLENSTNGPVEFNITAYDKTGNVFNVTQDDITGNNVVIDTNNPSLVDLAIYSNNTNISLATINNNLSITITANETLKNANITILGSTYVMNVSGVVANANVTVDQNSAEGEVLFNITAFDLAGNNFTADQTQLNSSNVTIDTSSPILENLTIYSNNANTSLATVNNILSITITANETLKAANITILDSTYVMNVVYGCKGCIGVVAVYGQVF